MQLRGQPGLRPGKAAFAYLVIANIVACSACARAEQIGETNFHIDSVATEPAVPLNLALDVRIAPQQRLLEIKVMLGKRQGYPAEQFFDRDIVAQISSLPGLRLLDGSLSWSGDLRGEQTAEFVARLSIPENIDGTVEVKARGRAQGGDIDADIESFRLTARGDRITVSRETVPVISPMRPGDARQSN
jgi:hypothetical protein